MNRSLRQRKARTAPTPVIRGLVLGLVGLANSGWVDRRDAMAHRLNVIKHGGFERRRTNPALLENVALDSSEDARIQHFWKPLRRSKRCALWYLTNVPDRQKARGAEGLRWLPSRACGDPARRIALQWVPAGRFAVCPLPDAGSRRRRAEARLLHPLRKLRAAARSARVALYTSGAGATCDLMLL